MLDRLQKFFDSRVAPTTPEDDERRLRIATCALLLEAAHADDEFSAAEREALDDIVAERFDLAPDDAAELLALAEEERREAADLFRFGQLIDETFPRPRKLAIVELLWRVVYSDGVLASHEDALMHRIGKLLGVRHADLMAVKRKVKREREE